MGRLSEERFKWIEKGLRSGRLSEERFKGIEKGLRYGKTE